LTVNTVRREDRTVYTAVDEGLEKLVARHEVLAQSVEILTNDNQEMKDAMVRMDARSGNGESEQKL
jgi:hypothetical protein